jgi:hypothetical protein
MQPESEKGWFVEMLERLARDPQLLRAAIGPDGEGARRGPPPEGRPPPPEPPSH